MQSEDRRRQAITSDSRLSRHCRCHLPTWESRKLSDRPGRSLQRYERPQYRTPHSARQESTSTQCGSSPSSRQHPIGTDCGRRRLLEFSMFQAILCFWPERPLLQPIHSVTESLVRQQRSERTINEETHRGRERLA